MAALPLYEHWVLAHSLGLLAVTPLLLAVPTSRFSLPSIDRHLFEPAAIVLGTALVTALVYTQTAPHQSIIILCLLVAAFRLPSREAAVAVALVAVEGAVLTSLGSGPVASSLADPYERMFALQARLAAIGGEAEVAAGADAPETTSEGALLDKTHINQLCAAIGPARFDGLLTLLAKELVERPTIIRRAVLAGDFARARSESHSLKGATMSVGAMAVGQAAAALELAPDAVAMNLALAHLDRQVARTRQAIATLVPPSLPNRKAG